MFAVLSQGLAMLAAGGMALAPATASSQRPPAPDRFGLYYSGPPCAQDQVDRSFGQFQVNLGSHPDLRLGILAAGSGGEAVLLGAPEGGVRLLTNASRADWLLGYPHLADDAGVWGKPILGPDCLAAPGEMYVEAIFPAGLLRGPIDPGLDLMQRADVAALREAAAGYRRMLDDARGAGDELEPSNLSSVRRGSASRLEKEIFSPEAARGIEPWRVLLLGSDRARAGGRSIEILLSGSDGSTGMFGHIAVGSDGLVYNVYPKGSDRGAPGPVPLWDYLFNAERGQALRRPTWMLRLGGVSDEVADKLNEEMTRRTRAILEGRERYHPTANNCTTVSLDALAGLGFDLSAARYFTRRFPRPAFGHILNKLPRLVASGDLGVDRVELSFIPQVPVRPFDGGAPNRPLRDRARIN